VKSLSILTYLLLLIPVSAHSQSFKGIVVDSKTGEALPYANIGIRGKQIGGISDKQGHFVIDLSSALPGDVLVISYVGYLSREFEVANLDFSKKNTVELIPEVRQLNEVVVHDKRSFVVLGNKVKSARHTGWGDFSSSKGRAIGLMIPEYDVAVRVNSVFFHLDACEFDSALVRVNFFSLDGEQLTSFASHQKNIFHTINQKKGWVEVRIWEDIILRNEKVIVAIEWVDAWAKPRSMEEGGSYIFTISLAKASGYHYQRQTPEEQIQLINSQFTPSIYLACTPIQD
jgi:hypothetical protein